MVSRIKDRDECISKFNAKYFESADLVDGVYIIQNYITDIIGIRVICIYEEDVERACAALRSNFEVVEETNKSRQIEREVEKFGYKGTHLDLRVDARRESLPEYSSIVNQQFEFQVRTIVQDAWSEVDHKLKYKKQIPNSLKRRIHALAALFEVADREFSQIKKETHQLEKRAQ